MKRGTKITLVAVAAVAALLLLSLCGVFAYFAEHPPASAAASPYPPLDYSPFTNPANAAAFAAHGVRLQAYHDSYIALLGDYNPGLDVALQQASLPLDDDVRETIARSAPLRRELFAYLRQTHAPPYIDTAPGTQYTGVYLKLLQLIDCSRLTGLEAVKLQRAGNPAAARRQLDELLAVTGALTGRGSLMQELVALEMAKRAAWAAAAMYPLAGPLPPDRELLALAEQLAAIDSDLRQGMVPAFTLESLEAVAMLDEYRTKTYGPFYDHDRMLRRVQGEYARYAWLSTQDLWTITGQLGEPPERRISSWERISLPVNETLFSVSHGKFESVLIKKESARGTLRLLRLQLYLAMYRRRHNKLPDTLAELYADCRIPPVINPLTGSEYPYPGIIIGDRVDLSYDDGKALARQLSQD